MHWAACSWKICILPSRTGHRGSQQYGQPRIVLEQHLLGIALIAASRTGASRGECDIGNVMGSRRSGAAWVAMVVTRARAAIRRIIDEKGIGDAVAAFDEMLVLRDDEYLISENAFNALGYQYLGRPSTDAWAVIRRPI